MNNCKISLEKYMLYKKLFELYVSESAKLLDASIYLYNDFFKKTTDSENALLFVFLCDIYHNLRETIIILEDIFNEYYSANIEIKYKNTLTSKYENEFNENIIKNSNYYKKMKKLIDGEEDEECKNCDNKQKCNELISKIWKIKNE